ncbi:MAG: SAM-dependent methyltransferase, partial [Oscillospiraceae bacterium]|nr:SAM-dependent methyltransferase [Oscillospiraceae bacterium]
IRRGHKYDAIIMDPPSYGRGPNGEVWKLEGSIYPFVSLTAELLSDEPLFVLINAYTTGLSAGTMRYIAESVYTRRFGGRAEAQELGLPVTETGLCLPCGCTCRWEKG